MCVTVLYSNTHNNFCYCCFQSHCHLHQVIYFSACCVKPFIVKQKSTLLSCRAGHNNPHANFFLHCFCHKASSVACAVIDVCDLCTKPVFVSSIFCIKLAVALAIYDATTVAVATFSIFPVRHLP